MCYTLVKILFYIPISQLSLSVYCKLEIIFHIVIFSEVDNWRTKFGCAQLQNINVLLEKILITNTTSIKR